MQRVVVVGASLAGLRAAQALRKRGFAGTLTLIGEEPHAPYDRPPLSKQLLSGEWTEDKLFFGARENFDSLELDFRLGRAARSLDVRAREVSLDDGARVPFDGLIIATGASARRLRIATELTGIHTLRTLDDARAIRRELAKKPRLAVVGAGFIGLEVAATARKLGASVSVIEPQARPLLHLLGPLVAEAVHRLHVDRGVRFHFATTIAAIEGATRVEKLVLADGSSLEADLVVVGIGVTPETRWLEGSEVAISNGVLCDATCATSVPGIVAAGDVARWPNALFDETMRIEHWSNAVEQAQVAAARLLDGEGARPHLHVPYFWSDQYDVKYQFAGRIAPDDELVLVHGALDAPQFVALFGRAGVLRGVLTSNRPAQFMRFRKLLSERTPFEVAQRQPV
ncbi:MAG TPA: FAD-dependent oxidoreductase [Polyangiales bacterium]|jgi:3-phenylpropionate/trans-cinnamate dioxygenase ferredoxin reductase subunit